MSAELPQPIASFAAELIVELLLGCCLSQPILGSFRLFGRAPQDSLDQSRMQELFSEADADGSGRLDRGEVGRLMHEMGVTMDEKQLDNVMGKVGTPVNYPVPSQEPSIQSDASEVSLSRATHPEIQAKRNCR